MLKGTLLATAASLVLASAVSAGEPTRLTAAQMDEVSAGLSLALAAFLGASAAQSTSSENEAVEQSSNGGASTEDSVSAGSTSTSASAKRSASGGTSVKQSSTKCSGCVSAKLSLAIAGSLVTP